MNKEKYAESLVKNHEDLEKVLHYYPIKPESIKLLSSRSGRSKWLIGTANGNFFLRQEYINPKRMLFIAGAHWHLQNNGLPIAQLIPTRGGGLCLSGGDHIYILYEAHEGDPVLYYDQSHMTQAMAFAAKFHLASRGYIPADGSKKRTRTGKWHKLYRWKLQELEDNKKLAQDDTGDEFSRLFLEHVDQMLARGYAALNELNSQELEEWTHETIESGMFCQQDFTMARMILKNEQVFMKDLHSVTIDLPARDLRILLNKIMKKLAVWDQDLACRMLRAYDQVNPLTETQYSVLWTDLKFPHMFCAMAHKYFLGQKESWGDEKYLMNFRNVISVEESKQAFLDQFDKNLRVIKGAD